MVYFLRPIVQLNIPVPLGMNILTEFSCWVTIFFFQVLDVLAHCHLEVVSQIFLKKRLVLRNVSEQKGLTVRIFGKCFMYGTKNSSIWIFGMIEKKNSETHRPGTYIWEILTLQSASHFHPPASFHLSLCRCQTVIRWREEIQRKFWGLPQRCLILEISFLGLRGSTLRNSAYLGESTAVSLEETIL